MKSIFLLALRLNSCADENIVSSYQSLTEASRWSSSRASKNKPRAFDKLVASINQRRRERHFGKKPGNVWSEINGGATTPLPVAI